MCLHEASKPSDQRLLGSILPSSGCYIDDNRTSIAIQAVTATEEEWVLMIDPDIEFPANILEIFNYHIAHNPDARIIAGRVDLLNGLPVFYKVSRTSNIHQSFPFEGLKEFDLVGTGIILIHEDVFVKLRELEGHVHFFSRLLNQHNFNNVLMGDDFSFCLRAKRAGFKLYGAWDVYGIHNKTYKVPQRYLDKDQVEMKLF